MKVAYRLGDKEGIPNYNKRKKKEKKFDKSCNICDVNSNWQ